MMMGSLQEELSAALDGAELPSGDASEMAATEVAPAGEPSEAGSSATSRDGSGRFAKAENETTAGTNGESPAAQPVPPTDAAPVDPNAPQAPAESGTESKAMAPPATWSAGAKAVFATLPEVARREIAKREKDYATGIQHHAEKARGYDTLMAEFQPYEAMLRAEGGTPQGAIRNLLNTAYLLRTAPAQQKGELVMRIAQQFGADMSQYFGQQGEQAPAPGQQDLTHVQQLVQQMVAPALHRIQQWEVGQQTAQQQQAQQVEQEIQGQIEAFRDAADEAGNPKHLYFENVRGAMSALLANKQAASLEQAYDMACWANPEVRAALIADRQRTDEAKRLEEAKRKAQDARAAGFNVSGQGGVGIAGATQSSLRDELSSQLDAALGGARV